MQTKAHTSANMSPCEEAPPTPAGLLFLSCDHPGKSALIYTTRQRLCPALASWVSSVELEPGGT